MLYPVIKADSTTDVVCGYCFGKPVDWNPDEKSYNQGQEILPFHILGGKKDNVVMCVPCFAKLAGMHLSDRVASTWPAVVAVATVAAGAVGRIQYYLKLHYFHSRGCHFFL